MNYINIFVENHRFVLFRHHFVTGKLSNTKIANVVNGTETDDHIVYIINIENKKTFANKKSSSDMAKIINPVNEGETPFINVMRNSSTV